MNKILIADDEPNNRILLQEILEDFEADGTRLLYAADGAQALDIIRSEKPELVFLDIMLPEMDGLAVCRAVKGEPGLENIFIALLTAKSQERDKRKAVDAGADLYITKPFKISAIIDVVNRVFRTPVDR